MQQCIQLTGTNRSFGLSLKIIKLSFPTLSINSRQGQPVNTTLQTGPLPAVKYTSALLEANRSLRRRVAKPPQILTTLYEFVGIHREMGTPGSIPNPEVKHLIANDTAYSCVGK